MTDEGVAKKQTTIESFWFQNITNEKKKAYASVEAQKSMVLATKGMELAKKAIVLEETDMMCKVCKNKLEAVGRFDQRDHVEFEDTFKDVPPRALRTDILLVHTGAPSASPRGDAGRRPN